MTGRYALGIDVGSTSVSAAIARPGEGDRATLSTVPLGETAEAMPSLVYVDDAGDLLTGEDAARAGADRPERLVRLRLDAVGAGIPHLVGGRALPPERVLAHLAAAAAASVREQRGAAPDALVVTHPAAWGPHRVGRVRSALDSAGLPDATLLPEPVAAATEHDAESPVRAGQAVAVYDLGGSATRCSVVRRSEPTGFALVPGSLVEVEVGGVDFDDAVLRHVLTASPGAAPETPEAPAAWGDLRRGCVGAKEELSLDAQATIPLRLPGADASVRLTRAEFEHMVEPALDRTVAALDAAIDASGLPVERVVMVGGSSRLPRAMQRLSESHDRHVAPGAHPTSAIARGAALHGLASLGASAATGPVVEASGFVAEAAATGRRLPGWARWAAIASASAAVLIGLVLVANGLAPRTTAGITPKAGPYRQPVAAFGSVWSGLDGLPVPPTGAPAAILPTATEDASEPASLRRADTAEERASEDAEATASPDPSGSETPTPTAAPTSAPSSHPVPVQPPAAPSAPPSNPAPVPSTPPSLPAPPSQSAPPSTPPSVDPPPPAPTSPPQIPVEDPPTQEPDPTPTTVPTGTPDPGTGGTASPGPSQDPTPTPGQVA